MVTLEKIPDRDTYIGRIYYEVDREYNVMPEYSTVFTVQIEGETAYIMGMKGEFDRSAYNEIKTILQKKGVSTVHWETHKNGKKLSKVTYI